MYLFPIPNHIPQRLNIGMHKSLCLSNFLQSQELDALALTAQFLKQVQLDPSNLEGVRSLEISQIILANEANLFKPRPPSLLGLQTFYQLTFAPKSFPTIPFNKNALHIFSSSLIILFGRNI